MTVRRYLYATACVVLNLSVLFLMTSAQLSLCQDNDASPQQGWSLFVMALQKGDVQSYVDCTSLDSQALLHQRLIRGQQLAAEYQRIAGKRTRFEMHEAQAMVYLEPPDTRTPPYILVLEHGDWKIDLKTMNERIYFDQANNWHWR